MEKVAPKRHSIESAIPPGEIGLFSRKITREDKFAVLFECWGSRNLLRLGSLIRHLGGFGCNSLGGRGCGNLVKRLGARVKTSWMVLSRRLALPEIFILAIGEDFLGWCCRNGRRWRCDKMVADWRWFRTSLVFRWLRARCEESDVLRSDLLVKHNFLCALQPFWNIGGWTRRRWNGS